MAMVMYLFTCGCVCDNSNVYSTCNIHTYSKCITYNNAHTSKHDIGINVHKSHYFVSASAFIKPLNESCKASIKSYVAVHRGTQQSVCTLAHSTWS